MSTATPFQTDPPPFPTDANSAAAARKRCDYRKQGVVSSTPHLSCEIALSSQWRADEARGLQKPIDGFAPLASFRHARTGSARLTIWIARLPREVHASDWLDCWLAHRAERTIDRRDFSSGAGLVPDRLTEETQTVARWSALKDGDRLFVVEARAARTDYPDLAGEFLLAAASFALRDPERAPFAEALHPCESPRRTARFARPASWGVALQSARAYERVCLGSTHAGMPIGTITVTITSIGENLTHRDLFACELLSCSHQGVVLRHPAGVSHGLELTPTDGTRWISRGWSFSRPATLRNRPAEVAIAILENSTARAAVRSVGPCRSGSYGGWAIQRRAFELVRDTLQFSAQCIGQSPA